MSVIQAFAGLLIASLTAALLWILPVMFGERLGAELEDRPLDRRPAWRGPRCADAVHGYHGVITGCHRWDLHNALSSGFHAVTVAGMLGVLMAGFGLRTVAAVYVAGMIALGFARALVAHRVCPELQFRIVNSSWAHAKTLMTFGGKTLADALSRLLLFQSNNLIVASVLGPAALAVYARPNALMRHAETLVNKFAFVLTPAASSLESAGKQEQLRELVIQSTRYATHLTLPMVVTFVLMGISYSASGWGHWTSPVPCLSSRARVFHVPDAAASNADVDGYEPARVVGITSLMMSVAGVALGVFFVGWLGWGLTGAALAVGIPLTAGKGLFTAWYACHQLDIPVAVYLRRGFLGPLATAVPFAAALIVGRTVFSATPAQALVGGLALGAVVIAPLYWHFGIPANLRRKIAEEVSRAAGTPPGCGGVSRGRTNNSFSGGNADPFGAAARTASAAVPVPGNACDLQRLDETPDRHVYDESTRFLNTTENTVMGRASASRWATRFTSTCRRTNSHTGTRMNGDVAWCRH